MDGRLRCPTLLGYWERVVLSVEGESIPKSKCRHKTNFVITLAEW